MLLAALTLVPLLFAALALPLRSLRAQLGLLLAAATAHLVLTACTWAWPVPPLDDLLALDDLGRLFLSITSVLFLLVALYSASYLLHGTHDTQVAPRLFVPLLLAFGAALTLVTTSRHLVVMWVALEGTTLASAPLVYFYRRKEALEAAWKYLLLCSVGIALALLGTFLVGIAASGAGAKAPPLTVDALVAAAPSMARPWLLVAFVFALVGYGTKMGLAPLHTWLPDAHSQAPSPVSALLSGAVLNGALLGVLRFYRIALAAGLGASARALLVALGLASLLVAAALMTGQRDYKRLLAYSSVENMGVVAVGVGLGGVAVYGAMLHVVLHSFAKAGLFLTSGNVLRAFGTTEARGVTGALSRLPASGPLLAMGLFAIGGSPPFGLFQSELTIFQSALSDGRTLLAATFVVLLATAFLAAASVVLPMLQGRRDGAPREREHLLSVAPPAILVLAVLVAGLWVPTPLAGALGRVAAALGGSAP